MGASLLVPAPGSASAASGIGWSAPQTVDQARPFGHSTPIPQVACPSAALCVAVDGSGNVLEMRVAGGGSANWTVTNADPGGRLGGIDCPSAMLCVAFDSRGDVVSSSDPTGGAGAWSVARVASSLAPLNSISCPSVSLCVAGRAGGVYVSTDPAGGAGAWARLAVNGSAGVSAITCPSLNLCAGVDDAGDVITSGDPVGGASAWTVTKLFGSSFPSLFLSCPSDSLCVAETGPGVFETSTDPAGGSSTWQQAETGDEIKELTCASVNFCVGTGLGGSFVVSTNPASGSWQVERPYQAGARHVVCPTASLCLAFDDSGDVYGSLDPAGGVGTWTQPAGALDPPTCVPNTCTYAQQSVACPSPSSCVLVDHFGNVFGSDTPADGRSWRLRFAQTADAVSALSCVSDSLCVGLDDYGRLLTSTDPQDATPLWSVSGRQGTGLTCASSSLCLAWYGSPLGPAPALYVSTRPGSRRWRKARLFRGHNYRAGLIQGMSCPSTSLCVAATTSGILASIQPSNRRVGWRSFRVRPNDTQTGVSCPSVALCVIATVDGYILSSTNPGASKPSWRPARLERPSRSTGLVGLVAISCATPRLCVALDDGGELFSSTAPAGGRSSWHGAHIPDLAFNVALHPVLACRADSTCLIADGGGNLLTSSNPAGGAATWSLSRIDLGYPVTALSCRPTWCLAGDGGGRMLLGGE